MSSSTGWIHAVVLGVGIASAGACGSGAPSECKEAKPLIGEVKEALSGLDLNAAAASGEKLLATLKNPSNQQLKSLKAETELLVETLKKAQAPASNPTERDRSVARIDAKIRIWNDASAAALTKACK